VEEGEVIARVCGPGDGVLILFVGEVYDPWLGDSRAYFQEKHTAKQHPYPHPVQL
jgi:hypothetical protein